MFSVTTPAIDLTLLSVTELRQAAGVPDGSQDQLLTALGTRAALLIATTCRVEEDGSNPPTLLRETVDETIRYAFDAERIVLGRRFVHAITSVTLNGVLLDASAYEVDRAAGILYRLRGDRRVKWAYGNVRVIYSAGFATPPDDLKMAAAKLVASFFSETARDPNLKRERVDGIGEFEYWVGSKDDPAVPMEVKELLGRFMNAGVA